MNDNLLKINPSQEKERIVSFLKNIFSAQNKEKAVIGLSGGIDSATSFLLLTEALAPENIIVAHLYYFEPILTHIEKILQKKHIPTENIHVISIRETVDELASQLQITPDEKDKMRLGNVASRIRMIALFDLAKKSRALVCGTENKSEKVLGYFTRFGDQASDIEPIEHLYKTQVYQLAEYLGVHDEIISKSPSAGLWKGQTDEGEFGFTYTEADQVLFLHLEKDMPVEEIEKKGLKNAKKILEWRKRNLFKHQTPYTVT